MLRRLDDDKRVGGIKAMPDLLLELLSEEIPARMQARAAEDLKRLVTAALKEAGLSFEAAAAHVTPRRLALTVTGLPPATPDVREERRGPRADAPDKAVEGFLRGAGITRDACEERETPKGTFLFAVIERPGRATADMLTDILPAIIRKFPWPKAQRWGSASATMEALRWVRPLNSILCLLDGAVVPFDIDGIAAGDRTEGHRFMAPGAFAVDGFNGYKAGLLDHKVILDTGRRMTLIADTARTLASAAGLDWVEDQALLAEVAGLVEWPVPMIGSFDPAFLTVPEEVLILTMRQDQKYFVLRDPVTGRLAPKFIFVANIEPKDGGTAVTAGNERVLTARLADAKFFWDQDLKTPLAARLPQLADIVFHDRLGTVADRVDRMAALAGALADYIPDCRPETARSAAGLAKADLVSSMVHEFPEVQGVMGRYYAMAEGMDAAVADAIRDHYAPLGPGDACPTAPVSVAVALAEKLDTLVGFFGIGQPPTGSKDPYALRRAALGVIRLITENGLRLPLAGIVKGATSFHKGAVEDPTGDLLAFLADRLTVQQRELGVRHDLIDAVFAKGDDDLVRILARVAALDAFLKTDDGENLHAGYKRAANILRIEEKKDGTSYSPLETRPAGMEPAEEDLFDALAAATARADAALDAEDFAAAMAVLAALRAPTDRFFDDVTVNAGDADVRQRRLRLLARIRDAIDHVADFGKIEG